MVSNWMEATQSSGDVMMKPFGVPCMVEIFCFICSLLNVTEHIEFGSRSNPVVYDEGVPLFAVGLINSAIELGGAHIHSFPELLAIVQDELFHDLVKFWSINKSIDSLNSLQHCSQSVSSFTYET